MVWEAILLFDIKHCFDQIFRHIGIVSQQLFGVFRQAVSAARCQVLDNIFHKLFFKIPSIVRVKIRIFIDNSYI